MEALLESNDLIYTMETTCDFLKRSLVLAGFIILTSKISSSKPYQLWNSKAWLAGPDELLKGVRRHDGVRIVQAIARMIRTISS
jgi:hypothetical protein